MNGVGILNVGAGDTKLSFDKSNPAECIRAARIVKDMLRRGYALLVEIEVDGKKQTKRAYDFDEQTCEYIIADFDPAADAPVDFTRPPQVQIREAPNVESSIAQEPQEQAPPKQRGRPRKIPADKVGAVAVARTAGG